MNRLTRTALSTVVGGALAVPMLAGIPAQAADEPYKVLVVGKTLGFRHSSIDEGTTAIIALGQANGFTVDVWDPAPPRRVHPRRHQARSRRRSPRRRTSSSTRRSSSSPRWTARTTWTRPARACSTTASSPRCRATSAPAAATPASTPRPTPCTPCRGTASSPAAARASATTPRSRPPSRSSRTRRTPPPAPARHLDPLRRVVQLHRQPPPEVRVLTTSTRRRTTRAAAPWAPTTRCRGATTSRAAAPGTPGGGHTEASYVDPRSSQHLLGGIEWTAGKVDGGGNCVTLYEVDELLAGGRRRRHGQRGRLRPDNQAAGQGAGAVGGRSLHRRRRQAQRGLRPGARPREGRRDRRPAPRQGGRPAGLADGHGRPGLTGLSTTHHRTTTPHHGPASLPGGRAVVRPAQASTAGVWVRAVP